MGAVHASLGPAGIPRDWSSVWKRVGTQGMAVVTVGTHGELCGSDRESRLGQRPSFIGSSQYSGHGFYKLHIVAQYFSFTMTL